MKKQEQYFRKIQEYKDRFRSEATDVLEKRLQFPLIKEAAIAIREVLDERQKDGGSAPSSRRVEGD